MKSTSFLLLAVLVGAPDSIHAQRPTTMIPVMIATAAAEPFAQMLGGQARFAVDSVPDGWPKSLVPAAPARVLGGVAYGVGEIVLFELPEPADAAMSSFDTLLARAGWRPGRIEPRAPTMPTRGRLYCAESAFLTITPRDSSPGHTVLEAVRISTVRGMFSPGCDSSDHTLTMRADVSVPPLAAPKGATVVSQQTTVSFGASSFTATVRSDLSADAVLAHYAQQLAAKGWQLGRHVTGNGIAMQLVELQHESQRWAGNLTVGSLGDAYDVQVQVRKVSEK